MLHENSTAARFIIADLMFIIPGTLQFMILGDFKFPLKPKLLYNNY